MASKLGSLIDQMYDQDQKIKKQHTVLAKLKSERAALETKLLKTFKQQELDGARGVKGAARINRRDLVSIKDRTKFNAYVLKNKAFDLYQARVSTEAYFARVEEGETVPGVGIFPKISISITKRGAK